MKGILVVFDRERGYVLGNGKGAFIDGLGV